MVKNTKEIKGFKSAHIQDGLQQLLYTDQNGLLLSPCSPASSALAAGSDPNQSQRLAAPGAGREGRD